MIEIAMRRFQLGTLEEFVGPASYKLLRELESAVDGLFTQYDYQISWYAPGAIDEANDEVIEHVMITQMCIMYLLQGAICVTEFGDKADALRSLLHEFMKRSTEFVVFVGEQIGEFDCD